MKSGSDFVHNYPHRMELALRKLRENKKVNLHNRLKILKFLDYLETQQVGLARRIRYVQNLTKLAGMLEKDFEKATREDIEKIILLHGRLDLADETKGLFKVMTKRFSGGSRIQADTDSNRAAWTCSTSRSGLPSPHGGVEFMTNGITIR